MSVSRRTFLAGLAGAGTLAAAGKVAAAGVDHFQGYPGRFGLLHDTTLCTGCRSCEGACAQENHLPAPEQPVGSVAVFDQQRRTTDTALTVVNRYTSPEGLVAFRKQQCMHCNEPCCASVCLVHAFEKTPEGPVLYDPDVCIGCRYCVMACPYYALAYEYEDPLTPQVMRCTMCYPRIKQGQQPACSEVCPTGAILFGKRDELIEVARDRIRKAPDKYVKHVFGEHEFGGTSWLVLAGMSMSSIGLPENATHESLPAIGTSYLAVVPLVVAIYPGLLGAFHAFTQRKDKLAEEELQAAVSEAVAKAGAETRQKLEEAAKKAVRDKDAAVTQAVKKALAEAAKAAEQAK